MTDPQTGITYTYHLLGNVEAANPRSIIPAGGNDCRGTNGWISYAITHQLNADPALLKFCQEITGTNDFCGVMSRITMGCGYYLYCNGGTKDLKFSGNNVIYRIFVNTTLKEIYIGEFLEGKLIEVHKCYVGRKWFEEDHEFYEKPVTTGNPVCSNPPEEVKYLDPVAIIEATPMSGDKPLTVAFDGTKSYDPDGGEIVKYQWDFGEEMREGPAPEFTFDVADIHQIILTVFDDEDATDTAIVKIRVNAEEKIQIPPVARIISDNSYGFAPLSVNFDGESSYDPDGGDIVAYKWEQDGKPFAYQAEVKSYTFSNPGEYLISLTVLRHTL